MTPLELENRLLNVRRRLEPAAKFLQRFSNELTPPIRYQSVGAHHGFLFMSPDARHFCLLKGVRAVSGMHACIQLASGGFTQEIGVLIRTIVECTFLADWVRLESEPAGTIRADPQRTYVGKYFEDYRRDEPGTTPALGVKQGDVHRDLGDWLDKGAREIGMKQGRGPARRLMSNVYQVNSNFVHSRYPEVMDLYGGTPPYFHMSGMRATPKDDENIKIIETYATTVNQSLVGMARLFAPNLAQSDPELRDWMSII